jgi:solute carrier family 35, member E1
VHGFIVFFLTEHMTLAAGLFAAAAHGGSVLAMGAGAVSFAQIVKACEPVYVALLCLVIPPIEVLPKLLTP